MISGNDFQKTSGHKHRGTKSFTVNSANTATPASNRRTIMPPFPFLRLDSTGEPLRKSAPGPSTGSNDRRSVTSSASAVLGSIMFPFTSHSVPTSTHLTASKSAPLLQGLSALEDFIQERQTSKMDMAAYMHQPYAKRAASARLSSQQPGSRRSGNFGAMSLGQWEMMNFSSLPQGVFPCHIVQALQSQNVWPPAQPIMGSQAPWAWTSLADTVVKSLERASMVHSHHQPPTKSSSDSRLSHSHASKPSPKSASCSKIFGGKNSEVVMCHKESIPVQTIGDAKCVVKIATSADSVSSVKNSDKPVQSVESNKPQVSQEPPKSTDIVQPAGCINLRVQATVCDIPSSHVPGLQSATTVQCKQGLSVSSSDQHIVPLQCNSVASISIPISSSVTSGLLEDSDDDFWNSSDEEEEEVDPESQQEALEFFASQQGPTACYMVLSARDRAEKEVKAAVCPVGKLMKRAVEAANCAWKSYYPGSPISMSPPSKVQFSCGSDFDRVHVYEKDTTCVQEYMAAQMAEGRERRRQSSISDDEEDVPISNRFGHGGDSSDADSENDKSVFAPTPLRGKAYKKSEEMRCGESKKPAENLHQKTRERGGSASVLENKCEEKKPATAVGRDSCMSSGDGELSFDDLVLNCPEDETTTTSDDEEDDEEEYEGKDCETDDDDGIVFE